VPKSNTERLIIAFTLLYGVAIFSYFLGDLGGMFEIYKIHNSEVDEDEKEKLQKFFGAISKFNHNENINSDIIFEIEEYFDYRWTHFKNHIFGEEFANLWQ